MTVFEPGKTHLGQLRQEHFQLMWEPSVIKTRPGKSRAFNIIRLDVKFMLIVDTHTPHED